MKVRILSLLSEDNEILGVTTENAFSLFNPTKFLMDKNIINRNEENSAEVEKNDDNESEYGINFIRIELGNGERLSIKAVLSELE